MVSEVKSKRQTVKTGTRFGLLQVTEKAGEYRGETYWRCRCKCGTDCQALETRLLNGDITDCGCQGHRRKKTDLTGQRFGRLTAVRYEFNDKQNHPCWTFQCDCGNTKILSANRVRAGQVQSCGCLRRERTGNMNRKDLTGQRFGRLTAIRHTEERDHPGTVVWECRCDCGNTAYYSVNTLTSGKARSCGCLFHESRKECVKARTDLIEDTSLSGILAAKKLRTDNTSGVTGIYLDGKSGKWTAFISYKKKRYYLGIFNRKEDAIKARVRAEQEFHDSMIEDHWDELSERQQDEYLAYLKGIPIEYPPSVNI